MNEDINELFLDLESSETYKTMFQEMETALEDQWTAYILGGIILKAYSDYARHIGNKKMSKRTEKMLVNKLITDVKSQWAKITSLSDIKTSLLNFFTNTANSIGTKELAYAFSQLALDFKLTEKLIVDKLKNRIKTILTWMDTYTTEYVSKQIIRWIKSGKTAKALSNELLALGRKVATSRTNVIMKSESVALIEYVRYECARKNGVQKKTWVATMNERTCPFCKELHWLEANIYENFSPYAIAHPPVHPNCQCYIRYHWEESSCQLQLLDMNKKIGGYIYFENDKKTPELPSCVNVENIRTWGRLIWKDKMVGNIYSDMNDVEGYKQARRSLTTKWIWKWIDPYAEMMSTIPRWKLKIRDDIRKNIYQYAEPIWTRELLNLNEYELKRVRARTLLTDQWFVQLIRKLWYRRNVPNKYFT